MRAHRDTNRFDKEELRISFPLTPGGVSQEELGDFCKVSEELKSAKRVQREAKVQKNKPKLGVLLAESAF